MSTQPVRLNEEELRRPDFKYGTPVVLADGQEWNLRAPIVIYQDSEKSPSGWRTAMSLLPNDDYQDLVDRYKDLMGSDAVASIGEFFAAEFALGRRLLEANYDLDRAQVGQLLQFAYEDQSHPFASVRKSVVGVALGFGPKLLLDGDESQGSPSDKSPSEKG